MEELLLLRCEEMIKTGVADHFTYEEYEELISHYNDNLLREKALAVCKFAIKEYVFEIDFYYEAILTCNELEDLETAESIFYKGISLFPNDTNLMICFSALQTIKGNFKLADKTLKSLLLDCENQAEIYYQLGLVWFSALQYKLSKKYFLKAVMLDNDNENYVSMLHTFFSLDGRLKKGIKCFSKLTKEHPLNHLFWYYLGLLYQEKEQYNKAIVAFEFALTIDEEISDVWIDLGDVYCEKNRYFKALLCYKKALDLDYDATKEVIFHKIGNCYEALNEYNLAINIYKSVLEISPDLEEYIFALGRCYFSLNRWQNAKFLFNQCVELNYENSSCWLYIAKIEKLLKKYDKSEEAFEKANELNVDNLEVWEEWSLLYLEQNMFSKAIEIINAGISANPVASKLYYLACVYLFLKGDTKKALNYFAFGLSINFDNHEMIFDYIPRVDVVESINKLIELHRPKN